MTGCGSKADENGSAQVSAEEKNVAEKYGGFCQFDSLDSEFHAVVCIPMPEKNFVKKGKIM